MAAPSKSFCSVCSKAAGVRAAGTGWGVEQFLIPELPLPWPDDPMEARAVPAGVRDALLKLWDDGVDVGMFAVAPDAAYSTPGLTRILAFDFAAATSGSAARLDYLAPIELVAETIDSLARRRRIPPEVEIDETPYRDAMICTHGARDACCATFGVPLYQSLRPMSDSDPALRVWRATHFGGHRFAPTMMTFPDGRSWGYLDSETGRAILERRAPIGSVVDAHRGWSGYGDDKLQLLDQEALRRFGWDWLEYRQTGRIVAADDGTGIWQAEIVGETPEGERIELTGQIRREDIVSAIASCGGDDYDTPRYSVSEVSMRTLVRAGASGA